VGADGRRLAGDRRLRAADEHAVTDPSIWRVTGAPLCPPLAAGPLDGLTLAVKDIIAVGGYPIGAGNPAWLAAAPDEPADAWAVHALRAAGAAVAGIAQTDEFAFSLSGTNAHYGTPPNPAAPERVTGGSSSGPASAVATGAADIGLGTDTAGSIRVPASVCGLFGIRPTFGAVPVDGVLALAASFDTVGWLARDADVLRRVGSVLLPGRANLTPVRLLWPFAADSRVQAVAEAVGVQLRVGPVPFLDDLDGLLAVFRAAQAAEAWQLRGPWIEAHPGALDPAVEARFRFGASVSPAEYTRARAVLAACRARAVDALAEDEWLVLPAVGGPAHLRDASEDERNGWRLATLRHTVVASALGLPSCVLPMPAHPPVGLALVASPGQDRALLDALPRAAELRV
jgi:amidase